MATIKNSYPKEGETHDVLSVSINDTDLNTDNIFLYNFVFRDRNKEIGRIYIKEGEIHFEGDMTESAQIFFNNLKELWDAHTENKTGEPKSACPQISESIHKPDCLQP